MDASEIFLRLNAYIQNIDPGYNLPVIRAIPLDSLVTLAKELADATKRSSDVNDTRE